MKGKAVAIYFCSQYIQYSFHGTSMSLSKWYFLSLRTAEEEGNGKKKKSLCIELVYIYFELLFISIHLQTDWVLSVQPCSVDTCLNLSKKLSLFCWVCQEICRNKFRIWIFSSNKVSWSKTSNDLVKFVQRDWRLEGVNNLSLLMYIFLEI